MESFGLSFKKALYYTFSKGALYNSPKDRKNVSYWLHIFQDYENKLKSGEFCKYDRYSALIYPDTFRKVKGVEYVSCEYCGKDYPNGIWMMTSLIFAKTAEIKSQIFSSYVKIAERCFIIT